MDRLTDKKNAKNVFKLASLTIIAIIIALFSVQIAVAPDIGAYFSNYASTEGPTLLDFFILSVIFFAVCWVAFSAVFKEAKNANVVLSLAVGFALSVALVYGGKFTLKRMLPFAMIILFLLIFLGIFAMLKKFIFTKDTIMSKILSFIFALIVSFALLAVALNFMCSGNRCEGNAFMKKTFGSESVIGNMFSGVGNIFSGGPSLAPIPAPGAPNYAAIAACRNGIVDANEVCDVGPDGKQSIGCPDKHVCDNCQRCLPQSDVDNALDATGDFFGDNWSWMLAIIVGIVMLILGWMKRKNIDEWRQKRKKGKAVKELMGLFEEISGTEKFINSSLGNLVRVVKEEKPYMDVSRHIVDEITKDIKQTIGEEITLIKEKEEKEGLDKNLKSIEEKNNNEKALTLSMVSKIQDTLKMIGEEMNVNEELVNRINSLENVHEHFDKNSDIMNSLKRFENHFRQKGVIENIRTELEENKKEFSDFVLICGRMLLILDDEIRNINSIEEGKKISYHEVIERIRAVRNDAIKLNQLFVAKVNLLQYIIRNLEHLKADVHALHDSEVENLKQFNKKAEEAAASGNFDTAFYFASHVAENIRFLAHSEMAEESRNVLKAEEEKAKGIINACLPKVLPSVLPKIEEELLSDKFNEVKETLKHISNIDFIDDDLGKQLDTPIKKYAHHIKMISNLCEETEKTGKMGAEIYDIIKKSGSGITGLEKSKIDELNDRFNKFIKQSETAHRLAGELGMKKLMEGIEKKVKELAVLVRPGSPGYTGSSGDTTSPAPPSGTTTEPPEKNA